MSIFEQDVSPKNDAGDLVEKALVSLGLARRDRLTELSKRLSACGSPLAPLAVRALALATQLDERRVARLHPELELVWRQLHPDEA